MLAVVGLGLNNTGRNVAVLDCTVHCCVYSVLHCTVHTMVYIALHSAHYSIYCTAHCTLHTTVYSALNISAQLSSVELRGAAGGQLLTGFIG